MKWPFLLACAVLFIYWWFFSLPLILFNNPTSTAIYSHDNQLLGATIAQDGQWRFPLNNNLPTKYTKSVVSFEDERFYCHPGFDIFSIGRALVQNIKENKIISGASTISMQVIRLHRVNKPRLWSEKLIELALAVRLECRYSKDEILALWSAHAPFGGNVVGLEAASWRYYGRPPTSLSWGEATTLAVLPNAPTIIHPGKNRSALLNKRNRLLDKLVREEIIDSVSAQLAKLEPLPDKPRPMPQLAPHLLMRARREAATGQRLMTTIDKGLQLTVAARVAEHHQRLQQNEIHNAAVLILDVKRNEVISYIGNTQAGEHHGQHVDVAMAARSSGSILKPFLYAAMNQAGSLLPSQLVADIPTQVAGYRPKNFHDRYDGAVPADEALSRSLNIPAVRMLQNYGVEKFHQKIQQLGFSTIKNSPQHYGLSLILGGAEVNLWELINAYGDMARVVNEYHTPNNLSKSTENSEMSYMQISTTQIKSISQPALDAGSSYVTLKALTSVKRPRSELGWEQFSTARQVAWKTGTSIGFRDAWAIGVTPEYVVAVWVGNADGEGRPDLVGVQAAAPLMFDIFHELPATSWFEPPYDDLREVSICDASGLKSGSACPASSVTFIHKNGRRSLPCTYHKSIFTDPSGEFKVDADCFHREDMQLSSELTLPPAMAYYYQRQHPEYEGRLPYHPRCSGDTDQHTIEIVYPQPHATLKVPIDLVGEKGQTVFEVAHLDPGSTVFWHVDGEFMGKTNSTHTLSLDPPVGRHTLKVMDEQGHSSERQFEVLH